MIKSQSLQWVRELCIVCNSYIEPLFILKPLAGLDYMNSRNLERRVRFLSTVVLAGALTSSFCGAGLAQQATSPDVQQRMEILKNRFEYQKNPEFKNIDVFHLVDKTDGTVYQENMAFIVTPEFRGPAGFLNRGLVERRYDIAFVADANDRIICRLAPLKETACSSFADSQEGISKVNYELESQKSQLKEHREWWELPPKQPAL